MTRPPCGAPPGRLSVGCVRRAPWAGDPSAAAQRGHPGPPPCQGLLLLLRRRRAPAHAGWPRPAGVRPRSQGGVSPRHPGGAQIRRTKCRKPGAPRRSSQMRRSPPPRTRVIPATRLVRPAWQQGPSTAPGEGEGLVKEVGPPSKLSIRKSLHPSPRPIHLLTRVSEAQARPHPDVWRRSSGLPQRLMAARCAPFLQPLSRRWRCAACACQPAADPRRCAPARAARFRTSCGRRGRTLCS